MTPRLRMSNIGVACAVVAVLAVAGCSREPGTAYNAGAGTAWDSNPTVVPANLPVAPPGTQASYGDHQTEPYGDASAASGCAQPAAYGYDTPSYASRYGVRMVRARVMEEQPPIYEERRVKRHGRSTGKSVAIVASAGVGAAIGAIAGGGKGAAIGAIAGGSGGFAYDRLTHNR